MAKIRNVHAREIAAPASDVGEILDTLGSVDDRLWASGIWVAEPVAFDRQLGVGAEAGHGSIGYSVIAYEPGRRLVFRFAPGGGVSPAAVTDFAFRVTRRMLFLLVGYGRLGSGAPRADRFLATRSRPDRSG